MFQVKAEHIRRISFATKIFPKTKSALGLDISKLKSSDSFDGGLFCGGRSKNKDLLTFFGFIGNNANSCIANFAQLPTFRRSIKKLINIVETELELLGAQEVLLPTLVPQKIWHNSKRIEREQNALNHVYKFTDNSGNQILLGPTFEESMTQLVGDIESINQAELPLLLYQTSPKFRFEPNPRFGLIRTNEFLMNDLYSFDANLEQAKETYGAISNAYDRIFDKLGLKCLKIESGTGSIGGKISHEYQLPVSSGEDTILKCNDCSYACNLELYKVKKNSDVKEEGYSCLKCESTNIDRTQALELGHTFLLSNTYSVPLKAKYTSQDGKSRNNYEMGCYGLGLTRILSAGVDLLSIIPSGENNDSLLQLRWPNGVEPYKIGLIIPARRSKQYHGGSSEFIEKLVNKILDSTSRIDLFVEDRDKEGIGKRVFKLKSLGIPHIITVGERFLQDEPEVELLEMDSDKDAYKQHWFNEEQLCDYIKRLEE